MFVAKKIEIIVPVPAFIAVGFLQLFRKDRWSNVAPKIEIHVLVPTLVAVGFLQHAPVGDLQDQLTQHTRHHIA
jgi:hypothetical protein